MKQLYITIASKARRDITTIADRAGPCYYISSNYSKFLELWQLSRVKIVRLSGKFQDTFHTHRQEFIDGLSRLNSMNSSFAWWGSSIASKSTTANPLIQNITYLLCVERLLLSGELPVFTIIVDSPALAESAETIALERGYRVFNDFSLTWKLERKIRKQIINIARLLWFTIKSVGEKLVSSKYFKEIEPCPDGKKRVIIRSWVMEGSFNAQGVYSDRNFGDLPKWLENKDTEVLFLPMFYGHAIMRPMLVELIEKQDQIFLLPGKYLKSIDYLQMVIDAFKMKRVNNRNIRIAGVNIDGLLEEALKEETYPLASFDLHCLMLKRIKESVGTIDTVYYPFEGNAPEKKFIIKCRQYLQSTKIVGFQHTAFYKNLLTNQLGLYEKDCHPVPDIIISSGQKYKSLFEEAGFKKEAIVHGANLRYQEVHCEKSGQTNKKMRPKVLLLPLTFSYELAYELIDQTCRAVQENNEYEIYIRNHPLLKKKKITGFLEKIGLRDYAFADGGSIQNWFGKSYAVISAGGSITILEAIVSAIPVVRLMPANTVYLDPYSDTEYPLAPVNSAPEIREQLDQIEIIMETNPNVFTRIATQTLADYYTKPDKDNTTMFYHHADNLRQERNLNLPEKIRTLIQSGIFNSKMRFNQFFGLPAQTRKEICLFKKIFDFVIAAHESINIFEWGSGHSSIYYSKYFKKSKATFCWHSIDNNLGWHEKVKNMVRQEDLESVTELYIKEFPPFWKKPGWGEIPPLCGKFAPRLDEEIAYTQFPIELGIKFNVVIIDARFRKRCLQTARRVLAEDGIVIMHDAQKLHYHEGTEQYPYHAFLPTGSWYPFQKPRNKVWVGSFVNEKQIVLWSQQAHDGQ